MPFTDFYKIDTADKHYMEMSCSELQPPPAPKKKYIVYGYKFIYTLSKACLLQCLFS